MMSIMAPKPLDKRLRAVIFGDKFQARPQPLPSHIPQLFRDVAKEASHHRAGFRPWLAICAAVAITVNCPRALIELYKVAIEQKAGKDKVATAEYIREVGLKCISFNGIPRTVNGLIAFNEKLPRDVADKLWKKPSRETWPDTRRELHRRANMLWRSIYYPFDDKLLQKLLWAHPDLPSHIFHCHFGQLLMDPPAENRGSLATVGRFVTSVVAIACCRAQGGVEPQLISHIYGLQKSLGDGSLEKENPAEDPKTIESLTQEKGLTWMIHTVDKLAAGLKEEPDWHDLNWEEPE